MNFITLQKALMYLGFQVTEVHAKMIYYIVTLVEEKGSKISFDDIDKIVAKSETKESNEKES